MKETLEEAALKWFVTANKHDIVFDLGWIKIFEAGAKWKQEQMEKLKDFEVWKEWKNTNEIKSE
jgi:hypothetical protein